MSDTAAAKFSCEGCGKGYTWKAELAGKRAKCRCGQVMMVPAAPPEPAPESDDALYDFAPSSEPAPAKKPRIPMAPVAGSASKAVASPASSSLRPPGAANIGLGGRVAPAGLGYQTPIKKDRFGTDTLMDMTRDVYVPVGLLIAGFAMSVGYYAFAYRLGGTGVGFATLGVGIMTALKAALLVGFALVIAGPLGVSFGGIFTAVLKLAAIAVFSDGITCWVECGVDQIAGVSGMFGMMVSFPVALGTYWLLLIYLFSMDAGDSWLVVMLLAVFDGIVRWAILLLLLAAVLSWSGASGLSSGGTGLGSGGAGSGGGGAGVSAAVAEDNREMALHIDELKDLKLLQEAKEYIAGGRQAALSESVNAWYDAGCKNVWFEVSRDINGRMTPETLIVELPKAKDQRAKCYQVLKTYYDTSGIPSDPSDFADIGAAYITIDID